MVYVHKLAAKLGLTSLMNLAYAMLYQAQGRPPISQSAVEEVLGPLIIGEAPLSYHPYESDVTSPIGTIFGPLILRDTP